MIKQLITSKEKLKDNNSYILMMIAFFIPLSTAVPSILGVLLVVIWLIIGDFKEDFKALKQNKVVLAIVFFTLLYILSLSWSDDIIHALAYTMKKELKLLFIPLFMLFVKKEHIRHYLYAFIMGMTISEMFSYAIFFEVIPLFGHATYGSPNPFMGHIVYTPILAIAIYVLFYSILFDKDISKKEKITYGLFALTMSFNMFISGGRAGQVMFFAMLVVVLFQYFNQQKLKALIISAIVLPALFALFYATTSNFKDRVDVAISDISQLETNRNTSLGLRATFALNSLEIIKENFLFGVGGGGFKKNYAEVNQRLTPDLPTTVNPHNMYTLQLVELGLIGLISMLSIFFFQIHHALTQNDLLLKHLGTALPLLFLVIMFSESYLFIVNTAFLFALFSSFLYKNYPIANQVEK